jgi:hypothetical protein
MSDEPKPMKLVDGELVELTDAEIADLAAEQAANAAKPEPVPPVVTRFQTKAALASAGLLDAVESAIGGSDIVVRLAWSDALEFERASPTIAALASELSLSGEQVDDLFRLAATIKA